jgi:NAD(P)H-dependent FMN reductase
MPKIAIILGSTRPGRNGEAVAHWVRDIAATRADAEFELVDLADFDLPLVDAPMPPSFLGGRYEWESVRTWSATIASYDGFVLVMPEYNRSIPAALKNAVDWLWGEWHNKAAGFVSYGAEVSGARSVEHMRLVMSAVKVATVGRHVAFSLVNDFRNFSEFRPTDSHKGSLGALLDEVVAWSGALRTLRADA